LCYKLLKKGGLCISSIPELGAILVFRLFFFGIRNPNERLTLKQKRKEPSMAVILQMTYSKKLGLPNYSSHQCSVSLQEEIVDVSQLTAESKRLYALMQDAVDREMQTVGYLPDAITYGMHSPGDAVTKRKGETFPGESAAWKCSDKQKQLIEKIVRENDLDKREVEGLSREMFNTGVKQLNRLQASGLIDELLERHGGQRRSGGKASINGYRNRLPPEARGGTR
jgi:hypothetical protein